MLPSCGMALDWKTLGDRPARWRAARALAVTIFTIWAAALRAEVLVARYGPLPPGVASTIVQTLAAAGHSLRPRSIVWQRDPTPYVGGDPINYLKYAREMQSFYQAHVREPVYLALVRSQLWLLNDDDVAVSVASAISSVLVVPAAYLAGAAAFGPVAGLGAALCWAIEVESVSWAADGWRDDTFALVFTLMVWAMVRLGQQPSRRRAMVAGTLAGLTCLTRLSALLSVVAALAWIVIDSSSRERRGPALRATALVAVVAAALVGPFLVNCAIATGDPFYAVNYHTKYYRFAQGLSPAVAESALHFMLRSFLRRPMEAIDTVAGGLLGWPFFAKWTGFAQWSLPLAYALEASAAAGMVLLLWSSTGRLLLVLLLSSLVPYSLTWVLGAGGASWRFTEHIYPIYLIAAFHLLDRGGRVLYTEFGRRGERPILTLRAVRTAALVAGGIGVAALVYLAMPVLIEREAMALGEPITIDSRARHGWFMVGDWSGPHTTGNVVTRAARELHVGVRVFLPAPMDYRLTLRLDPASAMAATTGQHIAVFVNRKPFGSLSLTFDPARIGAYRLQVPRDATVAGVNRIDLVASELVPASRAGREFRWLNGSDPVAFRFWYFRLEPGEITNPAAPSASDAL
jgi:Dolichyl-phosphate-mannose-protein mannosyltransferase